MKKSLKEQLKAMYEWRHKCTLSDTLLYKRAFTTSVTLKISLGLLGISIIALVLLVSTGVFVVTLFSLVIVLLLLVTGFEIYNGLNTTLFICKEGLGIKKRNTFKTIPFKMITSSLIEDTYIRVVSQNDEITIPYEGFDKSAIDGLKSILRAEGFGGEQYPYALFFNDQKIILEAKEDPYLVQVFEKFKEKFRYFHQGLEDIHLEGLWMTRFQQLSDHSGVIHLKSLKVLKSHPLNAPMLNQKTDSGVLIFTDFQLKSLTHNGREIKSPYKTLRKLLHRSKIVKGEHKLNSLEIDFLSEKLLYKIVFTFDKAYAAWNAFEKDAWYQIN